MLRAFALTLSLLFTAPVLAAPPRDWSRSVTLAASGAHIQGNPAAKTKLVEYVSYTCPHCAHFVAESSGPLKAGWMKPGHLSVEIRNLVRDRYDLTAALLARCGGPARFIENHEALFAGQKGWIEKVMAYDQAPTSLENPSRAAVLTDIAEKTGLLALMAKRGINSRTARQCLADEKALAAVTGMTKQSQADKVTGTPSFLVDGTLTDAHDWASLRPLLPQQGK